MFKNRKTNLLITAILMIVLCAGAFTSSFAATAAEKRKEAAEAGKKAAEATKNFEEAKERADELQEEIDQKKEEIEETKQSMEDKKEDIKNQEHDLNLRLTAMYKTGTVGYIDVILSSDNISDLLSNIGMVQKILKNDQKLLQELEQDYKELDELKTKLEDEEIALEEKEAETKALVKKYKKEADKYKAKEEQLIIEANALAVEKSGYSGNADDIILANGGSIDTSNYAWPSTSKNVTSDYGWRICPFHGKEYHNGIDIGASKGTPVYAIQDGIIERASWYGGYGNCIILDCAGSVRALYGHLSGYNCKAGQYVKRGSVIGYVGSTGNSTGPHLHFTVFQNGVAISPWALY